VDPTVQQWGRTVGVDIVRETHAVESRVDRILHSHPVAITIGRGTNFVIPQIGLGGQTNPHTGAVAIEVAAASPLPRRDVLTVQLQRTLAHELNHAARITVGPGYGLTLLDAIVSEGLADTFATSLYPTSLAPWDHALKPEQIHRYWRLAQQHFYEFLPRKPYIHWMFGGGGFPHWTGYTLGAMLVAAAHLHHQAPWAQFTRETADEILVESHFNP
jgi:hypothetical protein